MIASLDVFDVCLNKGQAWADEMIVSIASFVFAFAQLLSLNVLQRFSIYNDSIASPSEVLPLPFGPQIWRWDLKDQWLFFVETSKSADLKLVYSHLWLWQESSTIHPQLIAQSVFSDMRPITHFGVHLQYVP